MPEKDLSSLFVDTLHLLRREADLQIAAKDGERSII